MLSSMPSRSTAARSPASICCVDLDKGGSELCVGFGFRQVPALPAAMQSDEAELEPLRDFLQAAATAGEYVPSFGLSWSTRPIM